MNLRKTILTMFAAAPALAMANVINFESGVIGEGEAAIADAGGACVSFMADGSEKIYLGFAEGAAVDPASVAAAAATGGFDSCSAALAPIGGPAVVGQAALGAPTIIGGILGLTTIALVIDGSDSSGAGSIAAAPPVTTPPATSPAE